MRNGIPIYTLAWTVALLPLVTIHVSYLIAASMDHVPWCVPYWDSCTSISATGRQLPEKIWFKLGMIPAALLSMCLWFLAYNWRNNLGPTRFVKTLHAMPVTGILAGLFLLLYTLALGVEGDTYRMLRRTGITLAFAFTFMAQLLLMRLIGEHAGHQEDYRLLRYCRWMLALIVVLLITGLASVVLDAMLGEGYESMEDAFEWNLALLLNAVFIVLALAWTEQKVTLSSINS